MQKVTSSLKYSELVKNNNYNNMNNNNNNNTMRQNDPSQKSGTDSTLPLVLGELGQLRKSNEDLAPQVLFLRREIAKNLQVME